MSQINDALKRAKQAQRRHSPSSLSAALPLRPFDSKIEEPGPNWIWPVAIILFFLLFAGLVFAVSAGSHGVQPVAVEAAAVPTPKAPVVVVPAPKPLVAVVEIAALKPAKPVRIQGIVYDPVNPWAIISGKTVHVGDEVDGMKVSAISRDAITLAGNGQTKQLHVGEK